MSIRLVILIVLAGVLAVAFAMRTSAPPPDTEEMLTDDLTPEELEDIRRKQTLIAELPPPPGEEPEIPPEFDVAVEVDPNPNKHRLYFYVTERHGYYVEGLTIQAWFNPDGAEVGPERSVTFSHYVNDYLEANGTLVTCMDIAAAELDNIGGDMLTTEYWGAWVIRYGRARTENRDPLPDISDEYDPCGTRG